MKNVAYAPTLLVIILLINAELTSKRAANDDVAAQGGVCTWLTARHTPVTAMGTAGKSSTYCGADYVLPEA